MIKKWCLSFVFFATLGLLSVSHADDFASKANFIFGNNSNNKFSYYKPTYFIFGKDDLKLQISGKYRLSKNFNLYFAFTQTMYWSIYITSQPFKDINYHPEIFYRIIDEESNFIKSIDFGFTHSSNGKDGLSSRSINRLYLKTNMVKTVGRHHLIGDLMLYNIVTNEENNKDIKHYMGYWDFTFNITDLVVHDTSKLNLEFRIFAGSKILNTNRGGRSIGLVYLIGSENFNPAFYLQYYSGYAENLLGYNKNSDQVRLGLMLYL